MEITLNVNINAPALVDLLNRALEADTAGKLVRKPHEVEAARAAKMAEAGASTPTPAFLKKEVEAANAVAANSSISEGEKATAARKGKGKTPDPVVTTAPAAAAGSDLTLDIVRARLSDYSADKRFGIEGVLKILAEFGTQRISDLPKNQYAEFKKRLDDALGSDAKPDPLA